MAKFQSTTFGSISGRHGTAVGVTRGGKSILRVFTKPINPRTEAQQAVRARFAFTAQLLNPFRPVFSTTLGRGNTGYNKAFRIAYHNAVVFEDGDLFPNWAGLVLSQGNLMAPVSARLTFPETTIAQIDWDSDVYANESPDDYVSIVLYNQNTRALIHINAAGIRSDGTFSFGLPTGWNADNLLIWLYLNNNSRFSDSIFLNQDMPV